MRPEEEHQRSSRTWLILSSLLIAASLIGVIYHQQNLKPEAPMDVSGFDVSSVNPSSPQASAPKTGVPGAPSSRTSGNSGSILISKDTSGVFARPGAKTAASSTPTRESEQEFMKQHDQEIRDAHSRWGKMINSYYRQYPVMRQIDADFSGLDRYMALQRRYRQDRDLYAWARDTFALPEVRATLGKYMADPDFWRMAPGLAKDALQIPSQSFYAATQHFAASDPTMVSFVQGFLQDMTKNIGAMVQGLPPGTDPGQMQNLARQFTPGATAVNP